VANPSSHMLSAYFSQSRVTRSSGVPPNFLILG
jgi:hypothetical protein